MQRIKSCAYNLLITICNIWQHFLIQMGRNSPKNNGIGIFLKTSASANLNLNTYRVLRNSLQRFKRRAYKKKQDWRTSQKHYALKFVVLGILQSQCTWKKLWLFPIRWIVRTCIIHWYHLEHHKPNQMYVKWIYIKIRHIVSQNQ